MSADSSTWHEAPMWVRPPHLILSFPCVAWLLERWIPYARRLRYPMPALGWLVILAGVGLIAWTNLLFRRHGTTHDPHGTSTALVTEGPFRRSRNPMYIGAILLLTGIAIARGTLAFYLTPLVFAIILQRVFIPREERRLEHLFGQTYRDYLARIPRWF